MSSGNAPRPFSLSLGARTRTTVSAYSRNPPRSAFDDEVDAVQETSSGPQLVQAFDQSTGGAVGLNGVEKPKAPLVIPFSGSKGFGINKRGSKNILPEEERVRRAGNVESTPDVLDPNNQQFGLIVSSRKDDGDHDVPMHDGHQSVSIPMVKPMTADEEAIEALKGNHERKSNRVIPTVDNDPQDGYPQRGDAEAPTLADYQAVPVEEFGKALLRGMGWVEGEGIGRNKGRPDIKPKEVKKRQNGLGIGATAMPADLASEEPSKQIPSAPFVLKNSRTGHVLQTEPELEDRNSKAFQAQEMGRLMNEDAKHDGKRSNRNHSDDLRNSRHSSSKRDRDKSAERTRRDTNGSPRRRREDEGYDNDNSREQRRRHRRSRSPERRNERDRNVSRTRDNSRTRESNGHRARDDTRRRYDDDQYRSSERGHKDRDRHRYRERDEDRKGSRRH